MTLDIGDIALCTVDKIVGTIVFVKIEGEKREGSIILSEIAPGRIRNLRAHVVPKKRIVCKVLRISNDRIDLSLRRVTQKERKEVMEQFKQEKSYQSILKSILGKKAKEAIDKIKDKESLYDFFEEAKQDSKNLEKIVGKGDSKKILDIVKTQKVKKAVIKKEINLTTNKEDGLELIKDILGKIKEVEINYISAGRYSMKTETEDMKKSDNKLKEILKEIEKKAKSKGMEFSVKEKQK